MLPISTGSQLRIYIAYLISRKRPKFPRPRYMRSETLKHHRYWDEKKYSCEHEGQTCEVHVGLTKVPEEWIETLWELYDESLRIEEAIQEQACYTRETFSSALIDPEYYKTVMVVDLSLIHISEPTRLGMISYAAFCLNKK